MMKLYISLVALLTITACQSPTDLNVDRSLLYMDGGVHPTRLSFYYYFGDSAYEAIVVDTSLLNTVWIEDQSTNYAVTIPQFIFQLPDTLKSSVAHTPFVRKLCFSTYKKPCDGNYTNCMNANSWLSGEYVGVNGQLVPFAWSADNASRRLGLAFYKVDQLNLIKGAVQIVVADPNLPRFEIYRALITLEF
ncbi:MAG: hypothetical protein HQ472_02030 [Ignavibacteria bacterium]|nr:hypothetical protein [Ignavibacteria bacterium]